MNGKYSTSKDGEKKAKEVKRRSMEEKAEARHYSPPSS